jgi:hypothetical protein
MAARWRVPNALGRLVSRLIGKNAPACPMRPRSMTTAPSWIGLDGWKIAASSKVASQ